MNIDSLADLATILSILLALYIFLSDRCKKNWENHKIYINQLTALLFELRKNHEIIINFIEKNEAAYVSGTKIAYFRFSLKTTHELISKGIVQDITLMRNIDAILYNQIQINKILDQTNLMGQILLPQSLDDARLIVQRIKAAHEKVIELKNEIKKYLPNVIAALEKHIQQTTKNHITSFCLIRKAMFLPEDLFKK